MTEIQNTGDQAMLVVRQGKGGPQRLIADLRDSDGPILAGRLAGDFEIVDTLRPHADAFAVLPRGRYLVSGLDAARLAAADVTSFQVTGSRQNAPVPTAATEFTVTSGNRLDVPHPSEDLSAIFVQDHGSHADLFRLYRLRSNATRRQIAAFVTHPDWAGLARLPVSNAFDLAALSAGRSVSEARLPPTGRYVAIAVPLFHAAVHRPQLRAGMAVSLVLSD